VQLSRLRVKNIRSYESADLEFGRGTTLIAGDVGAGKTSLLYAIEMALFGVAEVNAAYLVRHGAGHAEVSVAFEGPGKRYEISRKFRRLRRKGQDTFEAERIRFTVDGAETAYSATELRQQVIDLLGFPDNPSPQAHSDLWRWAVYVPQERMRDILGARPQERLETVRKALGVERYRTAAENAQELATDLRRSATSRRREADRLRHFDEEYADGNLLADRLRINRLVVERSLRDRRTAVTSLRATRDDIEAKARKAAGDQRELVSLEREEQTDQRSLDELVRLLADRRAEAVRREQESQEAKADADALEAHRAGLAGLEGDLTRLRNELDRLGSNLRSLAEARAFLASAEQREDDAHRGLERSRAEAESTKGALEEVLREGPTKEPPVPTPDDLSVLDQRLQAARVKETSALQEVTQAESSLSELEELLRGGICPRCQQSVRPADFESHRAEARASVDAARSRFASVEAERTGVEDARRARERYERAFDRWQVVEERRAVARSANERASRVFEEAARTLEECARSVAVARRKVDALLPEEEREARLRNEVGRLEQVRAERAHEVERSVLAVERRQGIGRALEALTSEQARLGADVAAVRQRLEERRRRVESLRAVRGELASLQAEVDEADRRLESANDELAADQSTLAGLEAQLDEAVRRVRAAEAGRRERAELLAEATDVEDKAAWVGTAFRATVLGMEQKLLTHAQSLFEREFARYFASLVDDPGLVARTDPAFTPLVMIEGEWTPAEALSGGERTSLALAFRLALAQVVRSMGSLHLDTILLDEPTDGFSPEQVIRMGELLEELALPQVILVSHESQLAAIADRVVRVQKVDGRSVIDAATPATSRPAEGPGVGTPGST